MWLQPSNGLFWYHSPLQPQSHIFPLKYVWSQSSIKTNLLLECTNLYRAIYTPLTAVWCLDDKFGQHRQLLEWILRRNLWACWLCQLRIPAKFIPSCAWTAGKTQPHGHWLQYQKATEFRFSSIPLFSARSVLSRPKSWPKGFWPF